MTRCVYTYMVYGKASALFLFKLCIRMYMCTYVCMYVRMYVCMYMCAMCVIRVFVCLYVSTNQDRGKAHDAPRSIKRG